MLMAAPLLNVVADHATLDLWRELIEVRRVWWMLAKKYCRSMKINGGCSIWCFYVDRWNIAVDTIHKFFRQSDFEDTENPVIKSMQHWKRLDSFLVP